MEISSTAELFKTDKVAFLRRAATVLVMFLCAFIAFRGPLSEVTFSAVKLIPDALIILFFALYSVCIRFRYKFKIYDFLFLAYLAVGFVSTVIVNRVGIYSFVFEVRSISVYYLLLFMLRNLNMGKAEFCKIVNTTQYITYVLLVLGIIEKVFNKEYLFSTEVANGILYADNFARVYSTFHNPNTYAAFITLSLFLTIFKRINYDEKSPVAAYIAFAVSLLLSMSRSAIIIVAAGLVFSIYLAYKKHGNDVDVKRLGAGVLAVVVGSAVLYGAVCAANYAYTQARISSGLDDDRKENASHMTAWDRFHEMGDDAIIESSNANGRLYAVKTGLEVFKDHPVFGSGFGTFGSAASLQSEPAIYEKYEIVFPFYADIQYICILTETGIMGSLVFLAFLLSILWTYRKNYFKLFLCVTVGWLGVFYNVFEVQAITVVLWSFLAFRDDDFTSLRLALRGKGREEPRKGTVVK